jgi:hypothetical protein
MKIAQGAQTRPNAGTAYDLSNDRRTLTVTNPDGTQTVRSLPAEDEGSGSQPVSPSKSK